MGDPMAIYWIVVITLIALLGLAVTLVVCGAVLWIVGWFINKIDDTNKE